MKLLIKNGRVIDPASGIDGLFDVLIDNGKISKIAKGLRNSADETIDATGRIVAPGLVDMHVHLRQPGREDKETVATGTASAAKGGVTSVLAMPNTIPAIDSVEVIEDLKKIIKKDALVNVFISAGITQGREGKELNEYAKLKKAGAVAITDDGSSVESDALMLSAFKLAKKSGINVLCHSEDKKLSGGGVVNAGFTATRLGLRGISKESEYKRVARDIELAQKAQIPVHICHVSCKETVEIIREAKYKGVKVTCETAPHYFSLSEEAVLAYDTNAKMNPPLRSKDDVAAIKQGIKDGTIDVIASDHAPHTENEKEIEFERAEFGVVGLETELAVSITELVDAGICNWPKLIEKLSLNPAKILGIKKGALAPGAEADVVVISPDQEWVVRKNDLASKSKNSPFIGRTLKGRVDCTICAGKIVYSR